MDRQTQRKVEKYVSAAKDPKAAFDRISEGTGTAEDIETLRTLYPRMYQRYVDSVMNELTNSKVVPERKQRAYLHYALGIPVSREQQPDYIVWAQQAVQGDVPQEQDPVEPVIPKSKVNPLDTKADTVMSRGDAIMSRE
jgi:hypothetical protein